MDRKYEMGKIFGRLIETRCSIYVRKTSSWYRQQKTVLFIFIFREIDLENSLNMIRLPRTSEVSKSQ
jgi:hypothetical protein